MKKKKYYLETPNGKEEVYILDFEDIFILTNKDILNHKATKEIVQKIQNLKAEDYNSLPFCKSHQPEIPKVKYFDISESTLSKLENQHLEKNPNADDTNPLGYGVEDWRAEAKIGPYEVYICHPSYYVSRYTDPVLNSVVEVCEKYGLV